MSTISTLAASLNAQQAQADLIAQVTVDLVRAWAGGKHLDDMYRDLLTNATDSSGVDQMVYQLEGDPEYAENAALIVLSAAWNYPELQDEIRSLAASASTSPRSISSTELAQSVLYGMFLMARNGAEVMDVAFRNAQGNIETQSADAAVSTATLFNAVRDQYAASL